LPPIGRPDRQEDGKGGTDAKRRLQVDAAKAGQGPASQQAIAILTRVNPQREEPDVQ
jgi:hypothetical protein